MSGQTFFYGVHCGIKEALYICSTQTHKAMRSHRQTYQAPKPVIHEAMMAIKPKHVKTIKYIIEPFTLSQVLTVSFGRFGLRCVVSRKHANDYTTSVKFTDSATGAGCAINTNGKHVCQFKSEWAVGGSPIIGYYFVGDQRVDVRIADVLTESEYELIRETIEWVWATINSGTVSFPDGTTNQY